MATLHGVLRRAAGLDAEPQNLSASIKEATVQLNAFLKQAGAVPALSEMALTAPEAEVRQLASLELRKLIIKVKAKTWLKTDQNAREHIKSQLLQNLESLAEPSANVRNGFARVVAAIARIEVPQNTWPSLLPWIWNQAGSTSQPQREVGLYTLFALIDTLVDVSAGQSFAQHTPQLYQLLSNTISDQNSLPIRVLSVRVLGKMIDYVEATDSDDVATLQALIPALVSVCQAALASDDDDAIQKVFDVMDGLTLSEAPVLGQHLPDLISFLLQAGANQEYSSEARMAPLNALLFIAKYKKSRIQALNLTPAILQGLLPIGAQEEPEEADEDGPPRVSFRIIDALANALPPAQVIDPLIQLCQQYAASPDAGLRKSAIMSFGVTFEGCSIYIVPHMPQLWPFVTSSLADSDPSVRRAACITVTFMCDMIGEECAKHHAELLPRLTELVNQEYTRRNALNALDSLLEVLGKDIIPYLPALMQSLLALLPHGDLVLKAAAVGAIGSAAHASKQQFAPYFHATMQQLVPFLSLTEEGEQIELRGVTQDTVGTLAEAVGKDTFSPFFEPVMHHAFQGCATESASLRECSFIYFAVMSRVYKSDFAPFLPNIVPLLLASLGQDDKAQNLALALAAGEGFDSRTETPQASTSAAVSEDLGDDDAFEDLDEEDLEEALMGANSALTHEKETAANALDELFQYTGSAFLPYIERSVQAFLELMTHFNEGLRQAAFEASLNFIASGNKLLKGQDNAKWSPSANPAPINPDVQRLIDAVVPKVLEAWDEEDVRENVTALCDAFSGVLLEVGPAVVAPKYLEQICKLCLDVLERKSICQQDDDPDAPADAEQSEWDAHLIRAAGDLTSSLAITVGVDFASAFQSFLPALLQYAEPKRTASERAAAVGAVAECINGLQHGITPFTQQIFTVLSAGLADADMDVRSNSAFAMGSLVFQSTQDLSNQYISILSAFSPLFDRSADTNETNQACDNACGALARLILKNADALPLEQVLPTYLGCLPVRQDMVENAKIMESLVFLLKSGRASGSEQTILNIIGQVLQKQKEAVNDEDKPLQPDTLAKIVELLKSMPADQLQATGLAAFVQ